MAKKITTYTGTTRNGQTVNVKSVSALTHASIGINTGKEYPAAWGWPNNAAGTHGLQSTHRSESAALNNIKGDAHKKFMKSEGYISEWYIIELTATN